MVLFVSFDILINETIEINKIEKKIMKKIIGKIAKNAFMIINLLFLKIILSIS